MQSAHDLVIRDILDRKDIGLKTYGRELNTDSPEDMLQYAYEEALDLACYLRNEIAKRDGITVKPMVAPAPVIETIPTPEPSSDQNELSIDQWMAVLKNELLPAFIESLDSNSFTLRQLRKYMEINKDKYPYKDVRGRLSNAISILGNFNVVSLCPGTRTWRYLLSPKPSLTQTFNEQINKFNYVEQPLFVSEATNGHVSSS